MAYQNVGRPRFFIDNYQYLKAIGLDTRKYYYENSTPEFENEEIPYLNNLVHTSFENEDIYTLYADTAKLARPRLDDAREVTFYVPSGSYLGDMDLSGNMKYYGAILNHNLGSCNANFRGFHYNPTVQETNHFDLIQFGGIDHGTSILNCPFFAGRIENGSSIFVVEDIPSSLEQYSAVTINKGAFTGFKFDTSFEIDNFNELYIGGISMGVMYTMPHSPDLSLSMEIEFDGYDKIETLGGSTLTNIRHTGAPVWYNPGRPEIFAEIGQTSPIYLNNQEFYSNPFAVDTFKSIIASGGLGGALYDQQDALPNKDDAMSPRIIEGSKRNGRRNWSLKFSLVSDNDLFSSNYMKTAIMETASGYESSDIFNPTGNNKFDFNMFTDDSFIAQVWNKTLGGALPFIFQPDSENNNPDQFCIAEFDQDSLKVTQTAFRTYSFSVKIREVW